MKQKLGVVHKPRTKSKIVTIRKYNLKNKYVETNVINPLDINLTKKQRKSIVTSVVNTIKFNYGSNWKNTDIYRQNKKIFDKLLNDQYKYKNNWFKAINIILKQNQKMFKYDNRGVVRFRTLMRTKPRLKQYSYNMSDFDNDPFDFSKYDEKQFAFFRGLAIVWNLDFVSMDLRAMSDTSKAWFRAFRSETERFFPETAEIDDEEFIMWGQMMLHGGKL